MMDKVGTFLVELKKKAIDLVVDNDNLIVNGPVNQLSDSMVEFIKQNKQAIIQYIKNDENFFELSFGQLSLWTIYQFSPHSSAYHVSCLIKTQSHFNLPLFKQALSYISERHAILRTIYVLKENQPVQKILKHIEIPVLEVVKQNCTSCELESMIKLQLKEPFQLSTGPVARIYYLRNEQNDHNHEHYLSIVFHHIACDMISMHIFVTELAKTYDALINETPLNLPLLQLDYVQFATQQRARLTDPAAQSILNFWRNAFKEPPSPLHLPIDKPRPPIQTFSGLHVAGNIGSELKREVLQVCKHQGITPYVYLLTVYYILLYRYSGQNDIVVGTPSAGRDHPDSGNLLGYFVNVIPVIAHVDGEYTFAELLQAVRTHTLQSLANADIPFPVLVQHIQPQRDPSFAAIFNVMFNWNQSNTLMSPMNQSSQLIAEQWMNAAEGASHDIILNVIEHDDQYELAWLFNTDLFDKTTLQRMHSHFISILTHVLNDANVVIDAINCLSTNELHQIKTQWNAPTVQYQKANCCLHHLFEQQVTLSPNHIALSYLDSDVTYEQLNQRSNRLAHYLIDLGVHKESLVFVTLPRSIDQIVAILAICKAGGAYVPVDPSLPKGRVVELARNAAPRCVISAEQWWSLYIDYEQTNFIDINKVEQWHNFACTNPVTDVHAENLAYVIFTSGSTGKPKGVSIEHRSAVNTILAINELFAIHSDDCVLALSAMNFDLSVYDIFGTLAVGAQLILLPEEHSKDPSYWLTQCIKHKVTLWNSVPALMQMMIQFLANEQVILDTLRVVMLSGDWIPLQLPMQIRANIHHKHLRLYSLGGATEASIWSIFYPIETVDERWKSIPYGKSLPNQSFYVLNKQLQHCPIGVMGDLYIGGVGLARDYLNDPLKTNTSFIYHEALGERLYRTGDLGRYLLSGDIEFIGRQDNQVKLNGFRIELGEIEALLTKHSLVKRVIAHIREDSKANKHLMAYVETERSSDVKKLEWDLKQLSAQYLPQYMIPSQFIMLDNLPLTTTGKLNIQALREPESSMKPMNNVMLSDTERRLESIWQKILNQHEIDFDLSFFMQGGSSLLVIQLHHEIQKEFAVKIPIAQIFAHPYLGMLASYLDKGRDVDLRAISQQRFKKRNQHDKSYEPSHE